MTQKIVRFQQWRGIFTEKETNDLLHFHDWSDKPHLADWKHPYDNTATLIWNEARTKKVAPTHTFKWFEEFTQEFEIP